MSLIATIKLSWWSRCVYLPTIYLISDICDYIGLEVNPDFDLICKTAMRGATIELRVNK